MFDLTALPALLNRTLCQGFVVLLLGGLLFAPQGFGQDLIGRVQFTESSYRVGPGDVLSFQVYHQEEFSQGNILVRSDGMASFNGVGELPVRGKSVAEIQRMLEERVGELVIDPIVTVTIAQTKPGTVYLAGAVKHPGMYQLSTGNQNSVTGPTSSGPISRIDFRLSNILANAGGVKMNADLSNIQIKRGDPENGDPENAEEGGTTLTVNLWKMLKEGDAGQDVMLQSGDAVYIPELPQMAMPDADYDLVLNSSIGPETFPVRVIGELKTPGVYYLPGNSPYLNSAVAMAGGYTEGANKKLIAIRRFTGDKDFTTLYVDPAKLDVVLRPNDIVYVTEEKLHRAGRFFDNVTKVMKPFTDAAWSAGILGAF